MSTEVLQHVRKSLTPAQGLLLGSLTVGVLDITDAFVFFGLRGIPPSRILQSIASGLLGQAAYGGGVATAALGLLFHFLIAFGVVAVYYLASRRLGLLTRHPFLCGPVYGLVVFFIMQLVVLPLSAATVGGWPRSLPVALNGLLIHALGVGLPSALFASAVHPDRHPS
jgi:hypothetical protein